MSQARDSALPGKSAVVTGAARGIGAALALRLAQRGARVGARSPAWKRTCVPPVTSGKGWSAPAAAPRRSELTRPAGGGAARPGTRAQDVR
jgi:NAD(P)-dependent dehydrogenase (short-subunit alcohol dehydrogenase family)